MQTHLRLSNLTKERATVDVVNFM